MPDGFSEKPAGNQNKENGYNEMSSNINMNFVTQDEISVKNQAEDLTKKTSGIQDSENGERNLKRRELKVYAVTDRTWLGERSLAEAVEEAMKGGATLVELREKNISEEELVNLATEIKKVTDRYGVRLIVNDSPEAAVKSGAAGVHIGQDDMDIHEVRRMVGKDGVIGVSAHTVEEAQRAEADGADYLGAGAVFSTSTKHDTVTLSPEKLKEICDAVNIPVVAIGGINADNINELKGSGADGVAVVSAIFAERDICAAAKRICGKMDEILADKAEAGYPRFKAAIFDYDGTVVDSMGMWRSIGSSYARKLGADLSDEEADRKLNTQLRGLSLEESAALFREEYGAKGTDEEILQEVLDMVFVNYENNIECKEGIINVLDDMQANGIRMCIATASPRKMIESANARLGIDKYFDAVFTCLELETNKRQPYIYMKAAEFFGCDISEILVFEDVLHAADTAARAGFPVVGVYDKESEEEKDKLKEISSLYINSYADWLGVKNLKEINIEGAKRLCFDGDQS